MINIPRKVRKPGLTGLKGATPLENNFENPQDVSFLTTVRYIKMADFRPLSQ